MIKHKKKFHHSFILSYSKLNFLMLINMNYDNVNQLIELNKDLFQK